MHRITCRVCRTPAPAHDDAVLLCAHCRSNPDATARHVADVLALSERTAERLLGNLSTEDTRRYLAVCQARRAARDGGTMAGFERRYAATVARGDALAELLCAMDVLAETRAWAERAQTELDALGVPV